MRDGEIGIRDPFAGYAHLEAPSLIVGARLELRATLKPMAGQDG
jgi:hypothetical protein